MGAPYGVTFVSIRSMVGRRREVQLCKLRKSRVLKRAQIEARNFGIEGTSRDEFIRHVTTMYEIEALRRPDEIPKMADDWKQGVGRVSFSVTLSLPGRSVERVVFVGDAGQVYDPVLMLTSSGRHFVRDPIRFGPRLDRDWIARYVRHLHSCHAKRLSEEQDHDREDTRPADPSPRAGGRAGVRTGDDTTRG